MTALDLRRLDNWAMEYGVKPLAIAVFFVVLALIWTFPLQHLIAYPFVFLFFGAVMARRSREVLLAPAQLRRAMSGPLTPRGRLPFFRRASRLARKR